MEREFKLAMPPARLGMNHRRRLHWPEINLLTEQAKKDARLEILAQCQKNDLPSFEYAKVTFEQVVPNFRAVVDNDNLGGKCKPVLDAMVDLGMFKDDGPRQVEVAYRTRQQRYCVPWLRVLVSEKEMPSPLPQCSPGTSSGASTSSRRGSKTKSPQSPGGNLLKKRRRLNSGRRRLTSSSETREK